MNVLMKRAAELLKIDKIVLENENKILAVVWFNSQRRFYYGHSVFIINNFIILIM